MMNSTSPSSEWEKRRSDFNHDFMKNFFLMALSRWLRLLEGETDDPHLERTFLVSVLPAWKSARAQLNALLSDMEFNLSPARSFEMLPLSRCDDSTKSWLPSLVHELWLVRNSIRKQLENARRAVQDADTSYKEIRKSLRNDTSLAELANSYGKFKQFRDKCNTVAQCVERLGSNR